MTVRKPILDICNTMNNATNNHRNHVLAKKLWYGCYFKNWFERRKNRWLLEKARININVDSSTEPLISVIIPTYNRSKLLTERAIPSVLAQSYKNFELIVVGDHCTDDTEQCFKKIDDSRVKFVNLPIRESILNRVLIDGWLLVLFLAIKVSNLPQVIGLPR